MTFYARRNSNVLRELWTVWLYPESVIAVGVSFDIKPVLCMLYTTYKVRRIICHVFILAAIIVLHSVFACICFRWFQYVRALLETVGHDLVCIRLRAATVPTRTAAANDRNDNNNDKNVINNHNDNSNNNSNNNNNIDNNHTHYTHNINNINNNHYTNKGIPTCTNALGKALRSPYFAARI